MNKYSISAIALLLSVGTSAFGKTYKDVDTKYSRSSIYSILLNHTEQKFGKEIKNQFLNIPTPDQYNNHDLNVKVVNVSGNGQFKDSIDSFIDSNQIASRMVARWFDRNILTGECSMDLIKERGIYNASALDHELAARSARGKAMLEDAGEELIGQSFLLVNEIKYVDKNKKARAFGAGLKIVGALAGAATGINISSLTDDLGDMISSIKGFKVKITTHLYQLVWDDEAAGTFYNLCYTATPDENKCRAFEQNRDKFRFKYLGQVESAGSTTSFLGINEEEPLLMVRKACQRAIDENVADLQHKYDQFRIKAPVVEADDKEVMACIGLKEGIDENTRFEVLEAQEKDGKVEYKRIAVVKPVASKIWDNRFMAEEENAYGATFGATTFKKESGGEVLPGHLLRQID